MKRTIATILSIVGLATAGCLLLMPLSHAAQGEINVSKNDANCKYNATLKYGTVTATTSSCARVWARVDFKTAAGNTGSTGYIWHPKKAEAKTPSGVSYFGGYTLASMVINDQYWTSGANKL